jgi:hypothetical protein
MDDKKSKHAKWFWPSIFAERQPTGTAQHNLIISAVDWSRWVAISSLPTICSPSFSSMGGVGKK